MQFLNMTVASLALLATVATAAPLQPPSACAVQCHTQYHQGSPYQQPADHQAAQDRYESCMIRCNNQPEAAVLLARRHATAGEGPCDDELGTPGYTQKVIDADIAKLSAKLNATLAVPAIQHPVHQAAPAPAPQTSATPSSDESCTFGTDCYTQKVINADIAKLTANLNAAVAAAAPAPAPAPQPSHAASSGTTTVPTQKVLRDADIAKSVAGLAYLG